LPSLVIPVQTFRAGQLSQYVDRWKDISWDPVTIHIVQGYHLSFHTDPPLCHLLLVELAVRASDEVITLEVSNMLTCGVIVKVDLKEWGFFSPIFTVDKLDIGVVYGKCVIISKFLPFLLDCTIVRH
jgi:hypothetical protein